jgi:hypothetical protein
LIQVLNMQRFMRLPRRLPRRSHVLIRLFLPQQLSRVHKLQPVPLALYLSKINYLPRFPVLSGVPDLLSQLFLKLLYLFVKHLFHLLHYALLNVLVRHTYL